MSNPMLLDPSEVRYTAEFDTVFNRILKAEPDEFIIAGYASPKLLDKEGRELPDLEGDSMDLNALDEAFRRMMNDPSRRNLMGFHSNTQIGGLEWNATDSDGVLWKAGVKFKVSEQYPKKGLFVIAKLFPDIQEAKRYRHEMETKGNMLSFSIGGEALKKEYRCDDGVCRNHITLMDLHEVSSCQKGVNPEAKAFILKTVTSEAAHTLARATSGASLLKLLLESNH